MRGRLAWLLGGAGLAGAFLLRARRRPHPTAPVGAGRDPRAEELRQKLAESRAVVAEREEFEQGETPVDRVEDVEQKRRRVHERSRAAAEEMRKPPAPE